MNKVHDTRGARRRALAAERNAINKLPNDVLVSIFMLAGDQHWARHTVALVCKEWNEIYRSKDASPLHETLEINLEKGFQRAVAAAAREGVGDPVEEASNRYGVHGSRVVSWAQRRAGSVRKLEFIAGGWWCARALEVFTAEDLGALVAAVGPSLTDISVLFQVNRQGPFWKSLWTHVVPAGRLRSLKVDMVDVKASGSDLEALGQLAGTLEELELSGPVAAGLLPKCINALTELRLLVLRGSTGATAIPAGISSLKKLEELDLRNCNLSSSEELGKLKSLRELRLDKSCLPTVPAFFGELESLEVLDLLFDHNMQIDAPLDFLIEGCPRLREVRLVKPYWFGTWNPGSLAHLEAFKAKLLAQNPDAKVSYYGHH